METFFIVMMWIVLIIVTLLLPRVVWRVKEVYFFKHLPPVISAKLKLLRNSNVTNVSHVNDSYTLTFSKFSLRSYKLKMYGDADIIRTYIDQGNEPLFIFTVHEAKFLFYYLERAYKREKQYEKKIQNESHEQKRKQAREQFIEQTRNML